MRSLAPHLTPRCLHPAAAHLSIHSISDQSLLDALEFSQGTFEFKWLARIPSGQPPPPLRYTLHSAPALPFISHHLFSRPLRGRTILPSLHSPPSARARLYSLPRPRGSCRVHRCADPTVHRHSARALHLRRRRGVLAEPAGDRRVQQKCVLFPPPRVRSLPFQLSVPTPLTLPTPLTPVTP